MKVTPISRSIKANALTNPNPSFVSMVRAGANQKPFRAVRMDAAVPAETAEEATMTMKTKLRSSTATVAAIAPQGYGVMQIEFAKTAFPDEAAVKSWMDAGGYSDYEITETSKSFEIADAVEKFEPASAKRIDGAADGVSVFVGKLADPSSQDGTGGEASAVEATGDGTPAGSEDATGSAEPAAKAADVPSPAPRTRTPGAVPGEAPTEGAIADVVDAIAGPGTDKDASPPAPIADVQPVAATEAEKSVEEKGNEIIARGEEMKQKGVYEAAALGGIVSDLGWLVYEADYSGLSDTTVSTIKTAALALLEAFMQAAQDASDALTGAFKSADALRTKAAAPVTEAPAAPAAEAMNPEAIASLVGKAVAEAIAPFEDRVRTAETTATEATQRAEQAEAQLAERVEADANVGQTRKGAEEALEPVSTGKTAKGRSATSTTILRSFGSRHARKTSAAL